MALRKEDSTMTRSALAFIIISLLLSAPKLASAGPNTRVGIFDMQNAIQTVAEGKKARESLKKDWEVRQGKLKKKEEKIQGAMAEFQKQSLVMDEKARREKEGEIRNQMMELQKEGMAAQQEFQTRDQQLSGPILTKLRKLVADVSKAKGYNLVLDKNENAVLYFEASDEITDEVIKKYDSGK